MGWKQIDRRSFLKGTGATIALPLLEAMFPLRQALAQTATAPLRTMFVNWQYGTYRDSVQASGSSTGLILPSLYSSLEPYKGSMIGLRRIFNYWGNVDGAGDHARGQGTYLTQVHINKSETDIRNSISVDQMIANAIGGQTRVKSAYFSGHRGWGGDSGYAPVYMNISWLNSTTANTPLGDPYKVFETLLTGMNGSTQPDPAALTRLKKKQSILDGTVADSNRLMNTLGTQDKQKLDQYLTGVREVESRIARDIAATPAPATCNPGTKPPTNQDYLSRVQSFFDIMVLAAQCDSTRVFTFHMGSANDYGSILGLSGDHHNDFSHYTTQASIDGLLRINTFYAEQFARFLGKMNSTIDAANGKSLLYNSLISFGSELRDSNNHDDYNIPLYICGNAGGRITPGRLMDTGSNVSMANVWLTFMKLNGLNVTSFGEGGSLSTGTVAL